MVCWIRLSAAQGSAHVVWGREIGKAYVSYHLMPLYMNPMLTNTISSGLRQRMQGKSCFNFKVMPETALLAELKNLTAAAADHWARQKLL